MAIIHNTSLATNYDLDSRKDVIRALYSAAFKFFKSDARPEDFITFKEVHLSPRLRCDILHLSYGDRVTIIELKTCREDFLADNKWEKYMDYCDYFYFMCPPEVIRPKEIGKNAGLIWLNKGYYEIKQYPSKLKPKLINHSWLAKTYKKLAFRKFAKISGNFISLDEEVLFT